MSKIAFIGLGNMGAPMAANLVKAGHSVAGFDLVEAAKTAAAASGVTIAASAREAVASADAVVTMLPAGRHVLAAACRFSARDAQGRARHRLLDHRRRQRQARARSGRGGGRADARRAGLGRRRRRDRRHADLHVRRLGRGVRARQADPRNDGQAHRPLRRAGRGAGGQDLQQHDPRRDHDRDLRSLRARREAGPVGAGVVRRRLDLVRPVVVAHQLLPGSRAGAGFARQSRL